MSKLFPKSANKLPLQIIVFLVVAVSIATAGVTYYMTPKYTRVGYAPLQPVPFSHAKHVGEVGLDCRYCHSNVDKSAHSNVPTAQTCMNCHNQIKTTSAALAPIRESAATGKPVPITDPEKIYSGSWGRMSVRPFAGEFEGNKHVSFQLRNLSLTGRGAQQIGHDNARRSKNSAYSDG
jgi:hypothetical protein